MKKIKENADFIDKTKEKIDALLKQIDKYADDIDKVYEKQDELLAEYHEKYTSPEQKSFLETVDKFFNKLINYVD